jgi:hypothetical protein
MSDDISEQAGSALGAGVILALIAAGRARSRSALMEASGLSRSTVAERLSSLFAEPDVIEQTIARHQRPSLSAKRSQRQAGVAR